MQRDRVFWDIENFNHKNKNIINNVCKAVSNALDRLIIDCQKRLRSFKDNYYRVTRTYNKTRSGASEVSREKWIFYRADELFTLKFKHPTNCNRFWRPTIRSKCRPIIFPIHIESHNLLCRRNRLGDQIRKQKSWASL